MRWLGSALKNHMSRLLPHHRDDGVEAPEIRIDQITMERDVQFTPGAVVKRHRNAVPVGPKKLIRNKRPECLGW
jgi:hypothetical protein